MACTVEVKNESMDFKMILRPRCKENVFLFRVWIWYGIKGLVWPSMS